MDKEQIGKPGKDGWISKKKKVLGTLAEKFGKMPKKNIPDMADETSLDAVKGRFRELCKKRAAASREAAQDKEMERGKEERFFETRKRRKEITEAQKLREQFERRFPEMCSQMSQGDAVEFRTMRTADLYRLLEDTGYVVGQNKDIDGDGKRATWNDVKAYRERGKGLGRTMDRRKGSED